MAQWLVVAVSAVAAVVLARSGRAGRRTWRVWGVLTAAGLIVAAGPHEARKTVALLTMPLGLAWMAAVAVAASAARSGARGLARRLVLLAGILFAVGNVPLGTLELALLERPWRDAGEVALPPLDAVAVLGGGVGLGPHGRPQLVAAGDRLRVGVALLRGGAAPVLVVTGPVVRRAGRDVSLAEAAAALARQLGASPASVREVTGPRTTSEEVAALARLARREEWERVGLVTSAWHMGRAMALARREGLPAVPVPADFRGVWSHGGIRVLVPQAEGVELQQRFWWEVLGRLAGR